ncbi:arsenate reductase ArsC [Angustibacter peucedani]
MTDVPRILFACKANGGRSVASRVLAAHYGGAAVDAFSAGSEPGTEIHPEVAAVLAAHGLDVSGEVPKAFDPDAAYDVVVTMGCGETCPFYAGAHYEDWPLDDPKGQDAATVLRVVTEIDGRVRDLLQRLLPGHDLPPSPLGEGLAGTTRPVG